MQIYQTRSCLHDQKGITLKIHTTFVSSGAQILASLAATHRDKEIRHAALILLPIFPILLLASLIIPQGTVCDHGCEEHGIKPWKGAHEAGDQAP